MISCWIDNNITGSLTDYDQIALTLTHEIPAGAGSSASITASFTLIDVGGGLANLTEDVGGTATLFDGEDWTRAGFLDGTTCTGAADIGPSWARYRRLRMAEARAKHLH